MVGRTHVELCTTVRLRDVQRDGLHADEVLAARERPGDGERDGREVLRGPGDALPAVRDGRDLVHLEPDGAVAGPVRDVGARGGARHVHVHDARVVDRLVARDAELRAGGDGDGLCGRGALGVVAAEVGALDVGHLAAGI